MSTLLSVIVPVYNEIRTIGELLERVASVPLEKEVIVVDDCSTDGTAEFLRKAAARETRIKAFFHEENRGKGAVIRTALEYARGDIIIIQDADLEYDPGDYTKLIGPIISGHADVVYGSRFVGSEAHRVLYFWHYLGNRILTFLSNMFTNLNLTDMETGAKAFRVEVLKNMTLEQNRFGFEPEVTAKIARKGYRIYEVGVTYHGRTYAEGKKIGWRDGLQAVWCILKYAVKKPETGRRAQRDTREKGNG